MEPDIDPAYMWNRAWFPVTAFGDFACDCSVPDGEPTPIRFTKYHHTSTHEQPVVKSFGEMVNLWIRAIDSGAWYYAPDRGRWSIDFDALDPELEQTGII